MPAGLVIPFAFTPKTVADANQVNSNFAAVAAKFQGGIFDSDISASADIDASKLSQSPAKQIQETRLGSSSVSPRVLQDLSITASKLAITPPPVANANIVDGTIQKAKLATGASTAAVTLNQMQFTISTATLTGITTLTPTVGVFSPAIPAASGIQFMACWVTVAGSTSGILTRFHLNSTSGFWEVQVGSDSVQTWTGRTVSVLYLNKS